MYLTALNNIDYLILAIIFLILFLFAYRYRKSNYDIAEFLLIDTTNHPLHLNNKILGFGIVEIFLASMIASLYGISALFTVCIAVLLIGILNRYIIPIIKPHSIFDYIAIKVNKRVSISIAVISVALLMLLITFATILLSKLCLSLLGLDFANSVFMVYGLTLLYIVIGGYKAMIKIRYVSLMIVLTILLLAVSIAIFTLWPIMPKLVILKDLAMAHNESLYYYIKPHIEFKLLMLLSLALFVLPIISASSREGSDKFGTIIKVVLIATSLFCGFCALITQLPGNIDSAGNKIITYQAQLPNGEVGYVVKSVDQSQTNNQVPGIVPPILDAKTSLALPGVYDYKLAGLVMLRYYLKDRLHILVVILLFLSFILSISEYLFALSKILTIDIYKRANLLSEYGDQGLLWIARMGVIILGGGCMFLAQLLSSVFDSFWYKLSIWIVLAILAGLILLIGLIYGKEK